MIKTFSRDPRKPSYESVFRTNLYYVDTLPESGAVFKVAQNTFTKLWRRLAVALGVKFLEEKQAI